jgi:hypothetical protein
MRDDADDDLERHEREDQAERDREIAPVGVRPDTMTVAVRMIVSVLIVLTVMMVLVVIVLMVLGVMIVLSVVVVRVIVGHCG